jgi:transcription initiation factor TFIID subunit 13
MSYPQYTSPSPAGHPPPTSTTYPYGAYPGAYTQTPGGYTYQAAGYQAGVTSYGWTYPYSYIPHTQSYQTSTAATPTAPAPAIAVAQTPTTATTATTTAAPRTTTFTSYTPTYLRDNLSSSNLTGRSSKKQSNYKGIFAKECKSQSGSIPISFCC